VAVCPVYALPAPLHGTTSGLLEAASYAFLANLLGLPAGTVPGHRVQPDEESDRADSATRRTVWQNASSKAVPGYRSQFK
jgi:hypothetical protein